MAESEANQETSQRGALPERTSPNVEDRDAIEKGLGAIYIRGRFCFGLKVVRATMEVHRTIY